MIDADEDNDEEAEAEAEDVEEAEDVDDEEPEDRIDCIEGEGDCEPPLLSTLVVVVVVISFPATEVFPISMVLIDSVFLGNFVTLFSIRSTGVLVVTSELGKSLSFVFCIGEDTSSSSTSTSWEFG